MSWNEAKEKVFNFYSDPGHGWLEVSTSDLDTVGLMVDDFSNFSYRSLHCVFLEEDCDASKFQVAYKKAFGKYPEMYRQHQNSDSFVRSMAPIWVPEEVLKGRRQR